ncbi:MAG: RDD family protein [Algicola sp.]|nr:RDD family protein [Algicola sp.]
MSTDKTPIKTHPEDFQSAPFMRRFASWVYDFLTAVAIAMLSTVVGFIFTKILEAIGWIDLTGYEDMGAYLTAGWVFKVYLLSCLTAFFCYFWVRGGQTIGMRAWRLRVVDQNGKMISIKQAIIRFYVSLAGLGNLWVLVDFKNRQSLQDYAAKTRTIVLTKEANRQVYREL